MTISSFPSPKFPALPHLRHELGSRNQNEPLHKSPIPRFPDSPIPRPQTCKPKMRRRTNAAVEILSTPPSSPPPSPPLFTTSNPYNNQITTETLIREARIGTTAARNILSTAHETHVIALDTAESLQRQTAQLEAIAGNVEDTKEILTGAEDNIEKLTKPFWRRRKRGVDSQRGKWEIRGELKRKLGKERKEDVGGKMKDTWVEDYDEFDEAVRDELRAQDEILQEAGVVVEDLRVLAVGIGEEIEKEAEIVDGIDVVEVTSRIREGNRKLRHRLKLK